MSGPEPTAGEWLRRLGAGEVSAVELAGRQLELVEEANARLSAVAALDDESVLRDAAEADRRRAAGERSALLGVPITIKDSLAVAGLPCLSGSVARKGNVPAEDATVVRRVRAAGAIVLAKTTVPEYMWSYETESVTHGRTLNPYDPARTPGGSSGGEAALIGAGARRWGSAPTAAARSGFPATTAASSACGPARASCRRPDAGRHRATRGCSTWRRSARWRAPSPTSRSSSA